MIQRFSTVICIFPDPLSKKYYPKIRNIPVHTANWFLLSREVFQQLDWTCKYFAWMDKDANISQVTSPLLLVPKITRTEPLACHRNLAVLTPGFLLPPLLTQAATWPLIPKAGTPSASTEMCFMWEAKKQRKKAR